MGTQRKLESRFKAKVKKELEAEFPGCILLDLDPSLKQGIPDMLMLHNEKWAALEFKREANASRKFNQEYYVDRMNNMSFASFIYPENKEDILNALHEKFKS